MVTGRKPFEGADLPVVLQKVVREDPLPIREHEAPAALARVISRALCKEPEGRYQKAADMAADLVRFKRYFDTQTRQIGTAARERFEEIGRMIATIRDLSTALELPPPIAFDQQEAVLREKFPYFCRRPDGSVGTMAPFRRSHLAAITSELQAAFDAVSHEAGRLRAAHDDAEAGEHSLDAREGRSAVDHFVRAETGATASPRVARGLAQARTLHGEQQARADQIQSLLSEARAADRIKRWSIVLERCAAVLAIDPQIVEASVLADNAETALATEVAARARRVSQLVADADGAIASERFDRAARLISEALTADGDSPVALAAQTRLQAARAALQAREAAARAAEEAAHAARLAAEAERRAQAQAHARAAEARWTADDIVEALRLAELALSLERADPVALRIQGLARVRLREQAEAAARAVEAQSCLTQAVKLLEAAKYDAAVRAARKALALDPSLTAATALIADARKQEAEADAERQRAAAARDRDKQIDDMLKTARSALRAGEPSRAAYTIENALLLYPEHAAAKELLA